MAQIQAIDYKHTHTHTQAHLAWEDKTILIFIARGFEGECNVPRSLNTSISQTFISALSVSLLLLSDIRLSAGYSPHTSGHTLDQHYNQVLPSCLSEKHLRGEASDSN